MAVRETLAPIITIDDAKCTGCGTCVENCPQQILELQRVGVKKKARPAENWAEMCVACRYCQKFCPYGAVKIELPGHELW